MRCLLVDDDLPTLDVLRDFINWKSYGVDAVDTACNIEKAKELIKMSIPDIIVCDIEMPKGTGIDLIRWVRENHYKSQVIFLTCHESFEFATTAMTFDAVAYVTKPFSSQKVEAAIIKAIEKINAGKQLDEYSKYWMDNKAVIEQGFWKDLLFYNIIPQTQNIQKEMKKRQLFFSLDEKFLLLLVCINTSQMDETSWDDNIFTYAFCNLTSEVIFGEPVFPRIFHYTQNDNFYNLAILAGDIDKTHIKEKCRQVVDLCTKHLHCIASCYISESYHMEGLAKAREELEQTEREHLVKRGQIIFPGEKKEEGSKGQYTLEVNRFNRLFQEGDELKIVNELKKELEILSMENRLDSFTFHSIHQDFIQIVYSILYKNEIQAHILFSEPASQKLLKKAESSLFDMMKWATYITKKTIGYINELHQSESVVEKAKKFIHMHYHEDIRSKNVADHVYLTPDYLAKIFKAKTGRHIKNYINEYRIGVSKELLLRSDESISEIAAKSGFDNFSYFSTVFKKITGKTPYLFRKEFKL